MLDSAVYSETIAQEFASESTKWLLAVILAVTGTLITISGIATMSAGVVAAGGFIVFIGGLYAAAAVFARALER